MKRLLMTGTAATMLVLPAFAALATDLPPEARPVATSATKADGPSRHVVVSGPADIVITVERRTSDAPTVRWFPDNRKIVVPPETTGTVKETKWLDLDDFGGAPAPAWHEEDLPSPRSTIHITIETIER